MSYKVWNHGTAAITALLLAAICGRSQGATGAGVGKTFSSPEEAGAAVLSAAQAGDQQAMITIFGPGSKSILFTGDAKTDKGSGPGQLLAVRAIDIDDKELVLAAGSVRVQDPGAVVRPTEGLEVRTA